MIGWLGTLAAKIWVTRSQKWKGQGEGRTASNAGTSLSSSHHVTPFQWLLLQPESRSPHSGPANQQDLLFPTLPLTSRPFWSTPLTTSNATSYSGLGTGCSFWGNSLRSPPFRASSLTFFPFCLNAIFSVMSTLTFLLKIAACSHCWYLQVA